MGLVQPGGEVALRAVGQQPPPYEEVTEKIARLTTEVQRGRIVVLK